MMAAVPTVPPLPRPADPSRHPRLLVAELVDLVGESEVAHWCADLLAGADPAECEPMLWYAGGRPAAGVLEGSWDPSWACVWGARGLLYAWADDVAPAIVVGLGDARWRPAEMCLKVAAVREIGEAGPPAVPLLRHELSRVRVAACRVLGAVGDVEHVSALEAVLDDPAPDARRAAVRALRRLDRRLDLDLVARLDLDG